MTDVRFVHITSDKRERILLGPELRLIEELALVKDTSVHNGYIWNTKMKTWSDALHLVCTYTGSIPYFYLLRGMLYYLATTRVYRKSGLKILKSLIARGSRLHILDLLCSLGM